MQKKPEKLLTGVELELMSILWKVAPARVTDVRSKLPRHRTLAYTSISTILRILVQKRFLQARKVGRGHLYFPLVDRIEYEEKLLRHFIKTLFDGSPAILVKRLLESEDLSATELFAIQSLLNQKPGNA